MEDTSEERRKLEAEKEMYDIVASRIVSEIANLLKNIEMLNKIESVTEKGKYTGDEVIAMAKYVMEQRIEKAKELVAKYLADPRPAVHAAAIEAAGGLAGDPFARVRVPSQPGQQPERFRQTRLGLG